MAVTATQGKSKKKFKINKNKPLVHMGKKEFRDTFDAIGAPIRESMLDEARKGTRQRIVFACVFLVTKDSRKLLSYAPEYGDKEGIRQEEEFAEEFRRTESLDLGESLLVQLLEVPLENAVIVGD